MNSRGLWKEHPLKLQYKNRKLTSISLRLNLNKEEWKKVTESKNFAGVSLTKNYGKDFKKYGSKTEDIFATANEEGCFEISLNKIRRFRQDNAINLNDESEMK